MLAADSEAPGLGTSGPGLSGESNDSAEHQIREGIGDDGGQHGGGSTAAGSSGQDAEAVRQQKIQEKNRRNQRKFRARQRV